MTKSGVSTTGLPAFLAGAPGSLASLQNPVYVWRNPGISLSILNKEVKTSSGFPFSLSDGYIPKSPPHFHMHLQGQGWSTRAEAGGAHPVKVTRVTIFALRGETVANRRQFPHEEESSGEQGRQKAIRSSQPSRKPRHRVHQSNQRREDSHLPCRFSRRLRSAPSPSLRCPPPARLLLGQISDATPPDPDVDLLLGAMIDEKMS